MSTEFNIFVAKRNIIDYIYKSAVLEGICVSYPQVYAIYHGVNVPNLNVDEIVTINNLKHAWNFLFETMHRKINLTYICEINAKIGASLFYKAGLLRKIAVGISGTSWSPPLPKKAEILKNLQSLQKIKNPTDRAISLMLYLMRSQNFVDANKRTAMLCANKIMIKNGAGIISIPVEKIDDFKGHLINFYETKEINVIKKFIYDECRDGMFMPKLSKNDIKEAKKRSEIFAKYQNFKGDF